MEKALIGSQEWCSFENLNIPSIKARIDSGAKTSSIQSTNIKKFKKGKESWVSFDVNPIQDNLSIVVHCESKIVDVRIVKSSSGITDKRFVIMEKVQIGNNSFEIELTLANRDGMDFRMLLEREAMKDRFIVNPSKHYLTSQITDEELEKKYSHLLHEKSGLSIGLLATDKSLYSNKRLMEAGKARGHEMYFYNIQQCYMRLDTVTPEVRYRGGSIIQDLDAIIPRIRPSMTFYGCALLRQFHSIGTYCLNSDTAISQSRDKLFSSQLFSANDIQIPITGFAKSPLDTKDLINMVGGAPLVIKLLQSAQGKGGSFCGNRQGSRKCNKCI